MNFRKQVLLSALTLSILSACSKPLSEEETLSLAEQNIEAGKIAEASINIKNVIKENPQNAQARLLLGKLYFEQSNFLSADIQCHCHEIQIQRFKLEDFFVLLSN